MRTTLNLSDDVLEYAQGMAEVQGISLGDAVSRLARSGMRAPFEKMERDPSTGVPLFKVSGNRTPITNQDVEKALEQEYADEYAKAFLDTASLQRNPRPSRLLKPTLDDGCTLNSEWAEARNMEEGRRR